MARARNIKPSFFTNDELAENNCPLGRLLFAGLWCQADYKGDVEWRPSRLKVLILPYDECDIKRLAINLDKSRFISFYSDGDKIYLHIDNFEKHQNPHPNEKKKGSGIPAFSEKMRQLVDVSGLTINHDKSRQVSDESESDRADSLIPHPDSLLPNGRDARAQSDSKPTRKRFQKPTLDQLISEFQGRVMQPELEAQKFLSHYEANGWKVGKNPMKSWPHAVTNWATRSAEYANNQPSPVRRSKSDEADDAMWRYIAEHGDEHDDGEGVEAFAFLEAGAQQRGQH